jgi:uncharacterized membrane protein required for colicin V production
MTIWLLAVLLLASCAGLGYRQGVIRTGFSLVGIIAAALLAVPLGRLIRPLVVTFGAKDPLWQWILPPLIMFVVISALFKIAAQPVHHKVDVHQRYHAGDLRLALWERLQRRLGLCLGLINGTIYLVLISWVIFAGSYWTVQVATSDEDPRTVRLLNRLGHDLQSTGFSKVARSIDGMPERFYKAADVVGLVYANPLLEARLGSYPAFLGLAERGEFQQLSGDTDFVRLRHERQPIQQVISHPQVQTILNNPDLLRTIWATLVPNIDDLSLYLETGRSPKYESELILGRWNFNVNAALSMFLKSKPNVSAKEMQKVKSAIIAAYGNSKFLATTEQQAIMKNVPPLGTPLGSMGSPQTIQGTWKSLGGNRYDLTFPDAGTINAVAETDRLTITGTGVSMVFNRGD